MSAAADTAGGLWLGGSGELARYTPGGASYRLGAAETAWMRDGRVTCLLTTGGTLWIGTPAGVGRIDGASRSWFGASAGLPDARVTALSVAPHGAPYEVAAGTWRGVATFAGGAFQPLGDEATTTALLAVGSRLWVGTAGGGLRSLPGGPPRDPRFVHVLLADAAGQLWAGGAGLWTVDLDASAAVGAPHGEITTLAQDLDAGLWAGGTGGLWAHLDGVWQPCSGPRGPVTSLCPLAGGGVLVGAWDDGLWTCRDRLCRPLPGVAAGDRVWSVAQTSDGDCWATSDTGLYRCGQGCVRVWHPELTGAAPLGPLAVAADGSLWAGSPAGGGLVHLSGDPEGSGSVVRYAPDHRLPEGDVHDLFVGRDGVLWLATDAGLFRHDGERFVPWAVGGEAWSAYALAPAGRDRLWVGTSLGVAKVATDAPGAPQWFDLPLRGAVRSIAVDARGGLWAGTQEGLVQASADGRHVVHTGHLPAPGVRALAAAPGGDVWVATPKGLARWDGATWRSYAATAGLPTDVVWAVHVDASGGVWAGTMGGGAARFDGESFRRLGAQEGLPSNVVRRIFSDGGGAVWFLTDLGLARLPASALPARRGVGPPVWVWPAGGLAALFLVALVRRRRRAAGAGCTRDGDR